MNRLYPLSSRDNNTDALLEPVNPAVILSGLLFVFLSAGCATSKIAAYQPVAPAATEHKAEQSGLEVALDPFVERSRSEAYFDVNAVSKGIAILHARISNNTTDQTFIVEKKNIQLVPVGTNTTINSNERGIPQSHGGGTALTIAGAVGIGLGGIATAPAGMVLALAGAAMTSHSTEVQRNFIDKEMPDQTLAPGENMEGFIYFTPVKKDQDWTRTMTVKIRVIDTKTREAKELEVPLSY